MGERKTSNALELNEVDRCFNEAATVEIAEKIQALPCSKDMSWLLWGRSPDASIPHTAKSPGALVCFRSYSRYLGFEMIH